MSDHAHIAIARRLKRANGHLEKIIDMIEQGRPCIQIAQQLQAVEGAMQGWKRAGDQGRLGHLHSRALTERDRCEATPW